jgi:hypothetical protein
LAEIPFDRVTIPENAAVAAAEANGKTLLPFRRIFFANDVFTTPITGADGPFDNDFVILANHELLLISGSPSRRQQAIPAIAG